MRSDHCQSHHAGSKLLQELNENNLAVRRPRTDCRGPNLLWAASGLLIILQTSSHISKYIKTICPRITKLGHIIMNLGI